MILVTGATGTVGGEVLKNLATRGEKVRAMARQPDRLRLPEHPEVAVIPGDFDDPDSLRRALDGVTTVFLLTAPGPWIPRHDLAMVDAARSHGVRKVVKLSAVGGGEPAGGAMPSDWHAPGERALADSGMDWCAPRPSSFASNALRWAAAVRAGEPVPNTTGAGRQGVVDPRDVAAVAVEALLTGELDGSTPTLTGPELLSTPDQVAQLAAELGRPIATVDVPPEAYRERMLAAGLDPSFVDVAMRGQRIVREGGNAVVTGDVERILGRPAGTFRAWARDHRAAFLPSGQ